MSVLSKARLVEINKMMLGLGAPDMIDGAGYNKPDFTSMKYSKGITESMSNAVATKVCQVLQKYTKTQLTAYAADLKESLEYYSKQTDTKPVKVISFSKSEVALSWEFNKNISSFIKTQLTQYKWQKPDGMWVLHLQWSAISEMVAKFNENGFDTSAITKAYEDSKLLKDDITKAVDTYPVEICVERPISLIDMLKVSMSKTRPDLLDILRKHCMYIRGTGWAVHIEKSAMLADDLAKLPNLAIKGLDEWAELVRSWSKEYQLVDVKKLPIKFKPYKFQPEDAKKLLKSKVYLNANDMGAGKTFEQVLVGESLPMKKLVICPPSLRLNWQKEILNVNPKAKVHIQYSNEDFQVVDGWNIIGYSSLDKFLSGLLEAKFQVVMIDEAHFIQAVNNSGTPDSNRARAVLLISATAGWVYPITGTPKTNRNKNLFNILRLIRHPLTRKPYAFFNYGKYFCDGKQNGWGWDFNGNSNDRELGSLLSPHMIRHLKKDVLPNLKKQRIMIPLKVDLKKYHKAIQEYLEERAKSGMGAETLAALMRARKVLAMQKVSETVDYTKNLIEQGKKVVIITCFTDVVKTIEEKFKGNVVKIVGGMSDTAKDSAIQEFQHGKAQVCVCNIVAGGVGITLTASHNMVVNDFDWVVGNHQQSEDRICRGGQTEFCNIHYLYASGAEIDEILADTLETKSETINTVVDGGEGDELEFQKLLDKALKVA